jgi:hypothetical protein
MMTDRAGDIAAHGLTVEAFGVPMRVAVTGPAILEEVQKVLPPGSRPCSPRELAAAFALEADSSGAFSLSRDGNAVAADMRLETALEVLGRELRLLVALEAKSLIFIHAGAVAYEGRAIVAPGRSFAGKSTLVAALVRAGAVYYSDEYAVLDEKGLVHPFPKPLSLREDGVTQIDRGVESIGGVAGEQAVPLGAVVVTSYRAGAPWRPRRLSSGEASLALLSHAVAAQTRPAEALRTITESLDRVPVLEGERDDADAVAPLLLAELQGKPSGPP